MGRELSRSLQPLGNLVLAARRLETGAGDAGVCGNAIRLDLADPDSISRVVRQFKPRLIVNAAAYTAVDKAETDIEAAMAANAHGPRILAAEARRQRAAVVHYSTDYVFDGSARRAWREDDPTGPLNAYGRSKLAGEAAIQEAGVPHLILRTSWVYGVEGANFVKTMLRLGRTRHELSVVADQTGAPTSARAIADITSQILSQARGDPVALLRERGGLCHLACAGETTWHGFAEEIFRLARQRGESLTVRTVRTINSADYGAPAARPQNSRLDCRRLYERFGLAAPAWQVALEQSFSAIAACRD